MSQSNDVSGIRRGRRLRHASMLCAPNWESGHGTHSCERYGPVRGSRKQKRVQRSANPAGRAVTRLAKPETAVEREPNMNRAKLQAGQSVLRVTQLLLMSVIMT